MSDFASVLESVERDALDRRARTLSGFAAWSDAALAMSDRPSAGTHAAREAYAAQQTIAPSRLDTAAIVAGLQCAIVEARADLARLRALRRRAARQLHPDCGGDGAALAECNAMIDAALARRR